MDQKSSDELLRKPRMWFIGDNDGAQMLFCGTNPIGVDLAGVDLAGVNMSKANLLRLALSESRPVSRGLVRRRLMSVC